MNPVERLAGMRCATLAMLAIVMLGLTPPPPAQAHARLVEMLPAEGATVSGPLESLRLVFSEPVEVRFGRFALVRLSPDEQADEARRKRLVAALAEGTLPQGAASLQPVGSEGRAAAITLQAPRL